MAGWFGNCLLERSGSGVVLQSEAIQLKQVLGATVLVLDGCLNCGDTER